MPKLSEYVDFRILPTDKVDITYASPLIEEHTVWLKSLIQETNTLEKVLTKNGSNKLCLIVIGDQPEIKWSENFANFAGACAVNAQDFARDALKHSQKAEACAETEYYTGVRWDSLDDTGLIVVNCTDARIAAAEAAECAELARASADKAIDCAEDAEAARDKAQRAEESMKPLLKLKKAEWVKAFQKYVNAKAKDAPSKEISALYATSQELRKISEEHEKALSDVTDIADKALERAKFARQHAEEAVESSTYAQSSSKAANSTKDLMWRQNQKNKDYRLEK